MVAYATAGEALGLMVPGLTWFAAWKLGLPARPLTLVVVVAGAGEGAVPARALLGQCARVRHCDAESIAVWRGAREGNARDAIDVSQSLLEGADDRKLAPLQFGWRRERALVRGRLVTDRGGPWLHWLLQGANSGKEDAPHTLVAFEQVVECLQCCRSKGVV
jgi:hypothetical protein